MNTHHSTRIRTATCGAVFAFVACASTASPAFAMRTHGQGDGNSGTASISPYAVPIATIGGMTMAQYVQRHEASDPRTATVG